VQGDDCLVSSLDVEELLNRTVDLVPELLDDSLGVAILVPAEREPEPTGKGVGEHEHSSGTLTGAKGEMGGVDGGVGGVCS
jgi:hypothetical protein